MNNLYPTFIYYFLLSTLVSGFITDLSNFSIISQFTINTILWVSFNLGFLYFWIENREGLKSTIAYLLKDSLFFRVYTGLVILILILLQISIHSNFFSELIFSTSHCGFEDLDSSSFSDPKIETVHIGDWKISDDNSIWIYSGG